jgi:hypothetical protein
MADPTKAESMLKVVLLVLNAQTEFDIKVKDKAAQLLNYEDYNDLENDWYGLPGEGKRSMTDITDLMKEMGIKWRK